MSFSLGTSTIRPLARLLPVGLPSPSCWPSLGRAWRTPVLPPEAQGVRDGSLGPQLDRVRPRVLGLRLLVVMSH